MVVEISKVYKGVLITDSLENYIGKEHVSLCQFLFFLNITDIAQYVENNFYTDKTWHFKFNVEAMIKLVVVKFFRQKSFKKTISTLTEEEAWLLGFQEKDNEIPIPTGSALHRLASKASKEGSLSENIAKPDISASASDILVLFDRWSFIFSKPE